MFRELTRKQKQISTEACIALLTKETRGVLSVNGDDGYPYAMPMNHFYSPEDGCIYFHCGKTGHRLDSLQRSDKASFCVFEQGYREGEDWALHVRSVIVFGRVELVRQPELIAEIAAQLSRKFTQDEEYIRKEIEQHGHRTLLLQLVPEHMCGKLVNEA